MLEGASKPRKRSKMEIKKQEKLKFGDKNALIAFIHNQNFADLKHSFLLTNKHLHCAQIKGENISLPSFLFDLVC